MANRNTDLLGDAVGTDGQSYTLHFEEREGAAVINGPLHFNAGKFEELLEHHRERATDAEDARIKLAAVMRANGWTWKYNAVT